MEGEVKPEAQGEEAEALEATTSVPPSQDRPPSAVSRDSQGRPFQPEAGQTSPTSDVGEIEGRVPTAPHLPSPERTGTTLEGTMSNSALVSWGMGGMGRAFRDKGWGRRGGMFRDVQREGRR